MGQLVFQATAGGQTALVGPNPSTNFSLNVPAVNSTLATLAAQTFTGQQTDTVDASISGLTVGKGGGAVSTNTAVGYQATYSNTTGFNLTAIGYQALYSNTTTQNSTAVGYQAGYTNTTGSITAVGYRALYSNTTGQSNTAVGGFFNATGPLYLNTTGNYNTAIGEGALTSNTTASNNTAIGFQAGYTLTTGSANVYIGTDSTPSSATVINEVVIGNYGAVGKGASTGYIYANAGGVYQGNNSTLWSITSDQRLKKNIVDNTDGLNKIIAIQVRNFEYRTADEVTELEPQNAINIKGVQLGAIAQELQAILPDCVKTESTGVMSVDASNLTWYLVNAVKELNAKVIALENK